MKCEELDQAIEQQKKLIKEIFDGSVWAKVQLEKWKEAIEVTELNRSLLAQTIDNIFVFEDKRIEIHFRYQNIFEKMKIIRDFCLSNMTKDIKEVK